MSKYGSLLKKTEVFERLAKIGNRKDFLESLAQSLPQGTVAFPDTSISDMLGRVSGAAANLADMLSNRAELISEHNMAKQLASNFEKSRYPSYVTDRSELDSKVNALRSYLNTAIALETKVNATEILDPDIRNMAKQMKQEATSVQTGLTSFYRNQGVPMTDYKNTPSQIASFAPQSTPAKKEMTSPAEYAKSLSKLLMDKVDQLSNSSNRANDLKQIDVKVKNLQNLFKSLQNSNALKDYFAKMDIVKALQKAYNSLEYNDLEIVKSLEGGRGVPESPDTKI